jgi:hypothetical protein
MTSEEITELLDVMRPQISNISDSSLHVTVTALFNLVEFMFRENKKYKDEIQNLKNEINRLKGEQGKPDIKSNNKEKGKNISSEQERHKRDKNKSRKPKSKKAHLEIHDTKKCTVDKSELPLDAVFKGYSDVIVQDIKIEAVNIRFQREIYYSSSKKKTYSGKLPDGWNGDFSPGVKALILSLYHDLKLTMPSIVSFFNTHGVLISESTISNILTKESYEMFCKEKLEIVNAGLNSSDFQHTDDTGSSVNGINYYTHILCNDLYTAYFTEEKKDRLTVLKILSGGELFYSLNDTAYLIMKNLNLSDKWIIKLQKSNVEGSVSYKQLDSLLLSIFPDKRKNPNVQKRIVEACAIAGYRSRMNSVKVLICDDAPQFKEITEELGLCWIHEGRHYKKLSPVYSWHRELLDSFISDFWDFYADLKIYKNNPSNTAKECMYKKFDSLFTQKTYYDSLDERIAKTYNKRKELLLVLEKPYIPLHNNPAEGEVRVEKRKQDISFQTRTKEGTVMKDAGMTIVQTAKKLGVNCYKYFYDRISGALKMMSLADIILLNTHRRLLI